MARVVISKSPEKLLALAKLVYQKHTNDGATSPLNALQDHNWTDNGPKVAQVEKTVRASATLLNGIYKSSPKNLGEWGFEVNDTPTKKTDSPTP